MDACFTKWVNSTLSYFQSERLESCERYVLECLSGIGVDVESGDGFLRIFVPENESDGDGIAIRSMIDMKSDLVKGAIKGDRIFVEYEEKPYDPYVLERVYGIAALLTIIEMRYAFIHPKILAIFSKSGIDILDYTQMIFLGQTGTLVRGEMESRILNLTQKVEMEQFDSIIVNLTLSGLSGSRINPVNANPIKWMIGILNSLLKNGISFKIVSFSCEKKAMHNPTAIKTSISISSQESNRCLDLIHAAHTSEVMKYISVEKTNFHTEIDEKHCKCFAFNDLSMLNLIELLPAPYVRMYEGRIPGLHSIASITNLNISDGYWSIEYSMCSPLGSVLDSISSNIIALSNSFGVSHQINTLSTSKATNKRSKLYRNLSRNMCNEYGDTGFDYSPMFHILKPSIDHVMIGPHIFRNEDGEGSQLSEFLVHFNILIKSFESK